MSSKKILTIFTPTYNRKHTISRTYDSLCKQSCHDFDWLIIDDGSIDGTREWVESLGAKVSNSGVSFDWMGRPKIEQDANHFVLLTQERFIGQSIRIEYIFKPNGGLYTGYNTAYATIQTELCVCIDSDDLMPYDAVEKIVKLWQDKGSSKYGGIEGLDFDIDSHQPIGGYFPVTLKEAYLHELHFKKIHVGDTKQVMRTYLMKQVTPMVGFEGEKNFNPIYLLIQVCDKFPLLILNDNLCTVEYQTGTDSMSQGIFRQYLNSPRSFAKMRLLEMSLQHNSLKDRFRSAVHYISSCIISRDSNWFLNSSNKILTLLACPLGIFLYLYIIIKAKN